MKKIDEMVQACVIDLERHIITSDKGAFLCIYTEEILKRFSAEVVKAVLPELTRIDGRMNDPDGYYKFRDYFLNKAKELGIEL